ncbi:MAG: CCA tRNA nucleotidyltransferase [Planctomycetes bacterium]|nr:CCA tRNA nucleotidyltransferase [Planctomycetota bacterium]
MQDLSRAHASAARALAQRIATLGHRAWIVGGAVRDLALGRTPADVDMASAATPDEVERTGFRTVPVGRAFGTLVVLVDGLEVQHTTFRSEAGYADARRPSSVQFGATVEEDASRRDFTCNALYLDPSTDEVLDPTGGLPHLAARELHCVGVARERFQEDGLRLVRMARFAAQLELVPAPDVLAAAEAARGALRGVSPERVLIELETLFARPNGARALELLWSCDLLVLAVPGLVERLGRDLETAFRERAATLRELGPAPGLVRGLAALYGPDPVATNAFGHAERRRALDVLDQLRVARSTRSAVAAAWAVACEVAPLARVPASRAQRVAWMQSPGFDDGLALARAWNRHLRRGTLVVDALVAEREALGPDGVSPAPWLAAQDLEDAGIPRGPAWGRILREAEVEQLDGGLATRDAALAWLARRASELGHDGGNTLRSAKDSG